MSHGRRKSAGRDVWTSRDHRRLCSNLGWALLLVNRTGNKYYPISEKDKKAPASEPMAHQRVTSLSDALGGRSNAS